MNYQDSADFNLFKNMSCDMGSEETTSLNRRSCHARGVYRLITDGDGDDDDDDDDENDANY